MHNPGTKTPDQIPLYRSPRYTSLTCVPVLSGTDLCARRDPDGSVSLWLVHWSEEPGERSVESRVSGEVAIQFVRGVLLDCQDVGWLEHANLMEYLPGLYRAAERKGADGQDSPPATGAGGKAGGSDETGKRG